MDGKYSKFSWIKFIVILLIVFYLTKLSYEKDNEISEKVRIDFVTQILREDCLTRCRKYNVKWSDLVGPKLEYYTKHIKNSGEYEYSWVSKDAHVLVKVHVDYGGGIRKPNIYWITNN